MITELLYSEQRFPSNKKFLLYTLLRFEIQMNQHTNIGLLPGPKRDGGFNATINVKPERGGGGGGGGRATHRNLTDRQIDRHVCLESYTKMVH